MAVIFVTVVLELALGISKGCACASKPDSAFWRRFPRWLEYSSKLNRLDRFGATRSMTTQCNRQIINGLLLCQRELSWRVSCYILNRWRVSDDESRRVVSEGEGACSPLIKVRSHLPLRGKLGWMTPRVGVKTTLTTETRHSGLLFPSKGPTFLPARGCLCFLRIP